MNVLVIGLGSMGKRRIRLLKELGDITILGVDSIKSKREEIYKLYQIHTYDRVKSAVTNNTIDCAFVCTSPLSHANIINECLQNKIHVFSEINLVDNLYEENIKLAKKNNCVLFISSTFLYREETTRIIDEIKKTSAPINYIYHVGQYLPDWHPWENYKDFFIGNPQTNGCREIMAIEMPWLITAFGNIENISVLKSKNTNLNIDYNDNYIITLQHRSGAKGVFMVDVVSRKPTRHFEAFGENLFISWDGSPSNLMIYDISDKRDYFPLSEILTTHEAGYANFITEEPYRQEIKAFFETIYSPKFTPVWDFQKDLRMLTEIDKIEN